MTITHRVFVCASALFLTCCTTACNGARVEQRDGGLDAVDHDGGKVVDAGGFSCLDAPTDPPDPVLAAPLEGVSPRLLGERWFRRSALTPQIAVSGTRVALVAGDVLLLVGADNEAPIMVRGAVGYVLAGPVTDAQGNVYFAGAGAYSVNPDGIPRWRVPFGPNRSMSQEATIASAPQLSPDGILVVSATDGFLYGIVAETGVVKWKVEVGLVNHRPAPLGAGGGHYFGVTLSRSGTERTELFDVRDGSSRGALAGQQTSAFLLRATSGALGMVALEAHHDNARWTTSTTAVLDWCGRERWSLPVDNNAILIDRGGRLSMVTRRIGEPGEPIKLFRTDANGVRETEVVKGGIPLAIGADGTTYTIECPGNDPEGSAVLHALDTNYHSLWTADLGPPCVFEPAILTNDGVLTFARGASAGPKSGASLVRYQTASPGVMRSPWPLWRHDNRGTSWLGNE